MSLGFVLYLNTSEPNKIGKTLTRLATSYGVMKDQTSMIDPVIDLSVPTEQNIVSANYLYLYDFKRYYFIKNKETVRNGLWRITCHVDVLESFKTSILANQAIVSRQKNRWNLYLNDGQFKTYQDPDFMVFNFPHGFQEQTPCYTLAVSGDGSGSVTPDPESSEG